MAKRRAAEQRSKGVKVSLTLSPLLTWRLTVLAARLGRDRSDFAAELLDTGLSRYTFDRQLRALAGPEAREAQAGAGELSA